MPEADSIRSIGALEWLGVACGDLMGARSILADPDVPPRLAAFLAQQAAEKSIKAALVMAGIDIPRTHDLAFLAARLPDGWGVRGLIEDVLELTAYASDARYPETGQFPEPDDAASAVHMATLVFDSVMADLSARSVEIDDLPCR